MGKGGGVGTGGDRGLRMGGVRWDSPQSEAGLQGGVGGGIRGRLGRRRAWGWRSGGFKLGRLVWGIDQSPGRKGREPTGARGLPAAERLHGREHSGQSRLGWSLTGASTARFASLCWVGALQAASPGGRCPVGCQPPPRYPHSSLCNLKTCSLSVSHEDFFEANHGERVLAMPNP